jgi:hypothetical protein
LIAVEARTITFAILVEICAPFLTNRHMLTILNIVVKLSGLTNYEKIGALLIKILLFNFLIIVNFANAVTFNAGYLSGSSISNFGLGKVEATSKNSTSGYEIGFDHIFKNTFFISTNWQSLKLDFNDGSPVSETAFDLIFGKRFGSLRNSFSLMAGGSSQKRMAGYLNGTVVEFKEINSLGAVLGSRIISRFLSYDFRYYHYPSSKIKEFDMPGNMISHRISLNLGKEAFKYGAYYLTEKFNYSGDYLSWRYQDFWGLYLGWQF